MHWFPLNLYPDLQPVHVEVLEHVVQFASIEGQSRTQPCLTSFNLYPFAQVLQNQDLDSNWHAVQFL